MTYFLLPCGEKKYKNKRYTQLQADLERRLCWNSLGNVGAEARAASWVKTQRSNVSQRKNKCENTGPDLLEPPEIASYLIRNTVVKAYDDSEHKTPHTFSLSLSEIHCRIAPVQVNSQSDSYTDAAALIWLHQELFHCRRNPTTSEFV